MATLTLLTWLAALGMYIWIIGKIFPSIWQVGDNNGSKIFVAITMGWLEVIFGIASALISDIYGIALGGDSIIDFATWWITMMIYVETPLPSGITRTPVLFIAGLVALGTCSVGALAYNIIKGQENYYYSSNSILKFGSVGSFIVQGIGLVASVLGIISFYIEYFR